MSAATFARKRSSRTRARAASHADVDVEQRRDLPLRFPRLGPRRVQQRLQRGRVAGLGRRGGRFPPFELPLEEIEVERGVRFVERVDAVQRQQVLRARHRILQRAIGLVDPRGRLQRETLLRLAGGRKTVRMHFDLQSMVGAIERRRVEAEALRQAEELEMVAREIDHRRLAPPTGWLDVEGLAAAAGILDVGIVELEPFVQPFAREIELGPVEELEALRIDDHRHPVALERQVLGPDVVRVLDLVGEPRAAGRAHAEAQPHALAALGEADSRRASPPIRSM